jgi:hypothetical protein
MSEEPRDREALVEAGIAAAAEGLARLEALPTPAGPPVGEILQAHHARIIAQIARGISLRAIARELHKAGVPFAEGSILFRLYRLYPGGRATAQAIPPPPARSTGAPTPTATPPPASAKHAGLLEDPR